MTGPDDGSGKTSTKPSGVSGKEINRCNINSNISHGKHNGHRLDVLKQHGRKQALTPTKLSV